MSCRLLLCMKVYYYIGDLCTMMLWKQRMLVKIKGSVKPMGGTVGWVLLILEVVVSLGQGLVD